jgi:leucyl-tRNA---protein transferase
MVRPNIVMLNGPALDDYLAEGWFRMGCLMFTTDVVQNDTGVNKVHWLRYLVDTWQLNSSHKKLLAKNKKFKIVIDQLQITDALNNLYTTYKNSLPFSISNSLLENLFDGANYNAQLFIYDTKAVYVYDDDLLIAVGVFDEGDRTIAGIINFWHPAYKAYSLGKLLMLLKINHLKQQSKTFYYPGYVVEDTPKFDYKFFLGKQHAELWHFENKVWYPAKECDKFEHVK